MSKLKTLIEWINRESLLDNPDNPPTVIDVLKRAHELLKLEEAEEKKPGTRKAKRRKNKKPITRRQKAGKIPHCTPTERC